MKRIVFEAGRQSFFASHEMSGFDDFFGHSKCRIINANSKRNVAVFELEDKGRTRTFFMKRFIQPHLKDMLSAFGHAGKLCSQAEVEWINAKTLLENGIETYHPVCYGVQSRLGMERQSFFITEAINGLCLTDFLKQSWKHMAPNKKQDLVVNLGLFFQRIHTAKIRLPDSYIWHIYRIETGQTGDYTLGMIDLHRMRVRTRSLRLAAKDLGAFLFSLPDGFMDQSQRALFIGSYLKDSRIADKEAFKKAVALWEQKISSRRTREVKQI